MVKHFLFVQREERYFTATLKASFLHHISVTAVLMRLIFTPLMQPTGVAQSVLNRGATPASVVLQIVVPADLLCRRVRKDAVCVMVCGGEKRYACSHTALHLLCSQTPQFL